MDDDTKPGAGRAVERQAEKIDRRHREDDAREAFAQLDPETDKTDADENAPGTEDDRLEDDEDEDPEEDDRGPIPV